MINTNVRRLVSLSLVGQKRKPIEYLIDLEILSLNYYIIRRPLEVFYIFESVKNNFLKNKSLKRSLQPKYFLYK